MRPLKFILVLAMTALWAVSAAAYPVKINYPDAVAEEIRDQISERLPEEPDAEGPLHARRQARRAKTIVEGILNAYGYFDPVITTDIVGEGDQARPELTVEPGALFATRRLVIKYEGEPPRQVDQEKVRAAMTMQPGMAAVAAKVLDQERIIGGTLRDLGYPYAQAKGREVIGDKDAKTISVRYTLSAGPRVRLGEAIFPTNIRTKGQYLQRLNPLEPGELYDPAQLALYNSRLGETRLFKSSIAKLSDEPVGTAEDGAEIRNVELRLEERKRNTLTLGAGYDTSEGFGVEAELLRRNLTRRGDMLVANARAAQREFGLDLVWRRPNELGYGKGLNFFASASDENTDAFNQQTGRLGAGYEVKKGPQFQYSYGADARYIRQSGESERRDFQTISLNGAMRIDKADSLLDPRRGWRAEGTLKPTYAFSQGGPNVSYVRAQAQGRAYLPFGEKARYVLAGRLRMGTLVGTTVNNVPGTDRFFAGGGGSVRGYAYQAIGPFDADNVPLGGRSLAEASIEGRARITDTIGAVAFVDAGNVSNEEYPTLDNLRVGAGVGVRYMTPAGPIRLDIATPLNPSDRDEAVQIYISIGQAF